MNNIAKGKNIIKTYKIDNTKRYEEIRNHRSPVNGHLS